MHVLILTLRAGQSHPTLPVGTEMDAICMVDASDADEAQRRAWEKLGGLGWTEAKIKESLLLPKNPDLSRANDTMRQMYRDAVELGLVVVYQDPAGAT